MPTYRYKCRCGRVSEELAAMPGKKTVKCPDCGKRAKRVISFQGGIVFKGDRA